MKYIIIAAVSIDGVIGVGNDIPWNIPEDFKHFRKTTMNNVLLVGYNTYTTLPDKAFEGREYLVLNGGIPFEHNRDNVYQFNDLASIDEFLRDSRSNIDKVFVIGGASIYNFMIDYCDEAIITWVNKLYSHGDKKFPIDKLFNNFSTINDQNWLRSSSELLYKVTHYKRNDNE